MFRKAFTSAFRFVATQKLIPKVAVGTSLGAAFLTKAEQKPPPYYTPTVCNQPKNFDAIVRNTDELYLNYMIDNCYNVLKKFETSACTELLWRLARVTCEKAKLCTDNNERIGLMYEAFEAVKRAIEHEPIEGSYGAHKWYAIILDYVGEIEGIKSRIEKSYEVRHHLEKALQMNEYDATTWHILGLWHYSFANMGYATRMVAKAIFATPPTSDYDTALNLFMKAENMAPGFYSANMYYIGEISEQIGEKKAAIDAFKLTFRMAVVTADDAEIHKKAYNKLRGYGIKDNEM